MTFFNLAMKKITNLLTNKYLLAGLFFIVWMLFFDQRDYFQQKERMAELQKLEAKKKYYQEQIEKAKKELADLQNDPAALEKFARERYLMKRDGEDVYIIEDSLAATK
jgi:cell division protein DivIC